MEKKHHLLPSYKPKGQSIITTTTTTILLHFETHSCYFQRCDHSPPHPPPSPSPTMAAENAPSHYPPHSVSNGGWRHPPAITKNALKSEFHLCRWAGHHRHATVGATSPPCCHHHNTTAYKIIKKMLYCWLTFFHHDGNSSTQRLWQKSNEMHWKR